MLVTAKLRRRTKAAARTAPKALRYRTISGDIAVLVDAGQLVLTGDILERLGASELKDGYKSWYGRHVKKAFIAAREQQPVMVWTRHRTTGKWIHVCAYSPFDMALYIGLVSYKQTKHLATTAFFQAAYMEAA